MTMQDETYPLLTFSFVVQLILSLIFIIVYAMCTFICGYLFITAWEEPTKRGSSNSEVSWLTNVLW